MAIIFATVAIQGTRPLLWNHFGTDALPLEKRAKTGVAGNDPDEWKRKVLCANDRQLYLEPGSIFACIRDGAKYTPRRRSTLQPMIASSLQVTDDRVLVDRWLPDGDLQKLAGAMESPVYLDVRSVRNPSTRAKNIRYRVAASPGWTASFTLCWEDTLVNENEMHAVLRDAGQFVGLGDGRNIGFGRFQVRSFEMGERGSAEKQTAAGDLVANTTNRLGTGRKTVHSVRPGGGPKRMPH